MRILDNLGPLQAPFSQESVILDKILNDLKSKIPMLNKKGHVDEDEEVEETSADRTNPAHSLTKTDATDISEDISEGTGTQSLVDKIKSRININNFKISKKSAATDEDEESSDEEEEKPKSKKGGVIIKAMIVLALAALMLEPYLFPEEEVPAPVVVAPRPKKKKVKKEETETPAAEATPEGATEATPPIEAAVPATSEEGTSSSTLNAGTEGATVELPTDVSTSEPVTTEMTPTETVPTEEASPSNGETQTSPTQDIVEAPKEETNDENITDKILQDLEKQAKSETPKEEKREYVAPPNYEYQGRGLVYNCSGKHWACVDAPSYKSCEDNNSSVKFLKKSTECHPFNVYESQKGCESMQYRMITSNAKTDFCL